VSVSGERGNRGLSLGVRKRELTLPLYIWSGDTCRSVRKISAPIDFIAFGAFL
jgi:hypothetical protein